MYNIYSRHGEIMTEDAKIRFLFKKVQHQGLESAVEAMKAKITTEPAGTVTYTTVANHISTAVSELPDFLSRNRKVSAVKGKVTYGNAATYDIFNVDGSVNTGHHECWLQMGPVNRKIVNDERTRLGYGRGKGKNKTPGTLETLPEITLQTCATRFLSWGFLSYGKEKWLQA